MIDCSLLCNTVNKKLNKVITCKPGKEIQFGEIFELLLYFLSVSLIKQKKLNYPLTSGYEGYDGRSEFVFLLRNELSDYIMFYFRGNLVLYVIFFSVLCVSLL